MQICIISLFPEIFSALNVGIPGRAQKKGLIQLSHLNPRDFTEDKHRTVDDRPFGGGPGMVMIMQPLYKTIQAAKQILGMNTTVSYLSAQGKKIDRACIQAFSQRKTAILLTGRYEGIDQRLLDSEVQEEWSIGDFILSGGEFAALCLIDAIIRLLPGALGNSMSTKKDSFINGLLDHPHYTRPRIINGLAVPDVLCKGDPKLIERWRLKQALGQTWKKRPDLLQNRILSEQEQVLLDEFICEQTQ